MRLGIGTQLEHCFVEFEPVALISEGLSLGEQTQDDSKCLVHLFPLRRGINPHHISVTGERPWTYAEHYSAMRHMIELDHSIRNHQRMVIRQTDHARA